MRAIFSSAARVATLLAAAAAPALAQLPGAGAAATGLGDNYTAVARGVDAAAWNPAGLGMPGNPRFSLAFGGRADAGISPVSLTDVAAYAILPLPDDVRSRWLADIREQGALRLNGSLGGSPFALSTGRFAIQVGSQLHGIGELAPDAAELVLFGNAGLTGEPRDLSFAGTRFLTSVVTTGAVSYAQPLALRLGPLPEQHFAIGATFKYIVGNALAMGTDRSSVASTEPLGVRVDFPVVQSDSAFGDNGNAGSGLGLDVGASWRAGPYAIGASVQNVLNTFAWNVDDFYWRAGQATYGADGSTQDFDTLRTMADAPADVRKGVTDLRYAPVVALGGAWTLSPRVMLVADMRQRVGEGRMNVGAETHVGAGVELRPVRFLPIRLGGSAVTGGYRVSGGLGIELGWLNVAVSSGSRIGGGGSDAIAAFSMSIAAR